MSDSQPPHSVPSEYELAAWRSIQQFKGRPLSHGVQNAGERMAKGVAQLGKRAAQQLEKHPRAASAVARGQEFATKALPRSAPARASPPTPCRTGAAPPCSP